MHMAGALKDVQEMKESLQQVQYLPHQFRPTLVLSEG